MKRPAHPKRKWLRRCRVCFRWCRIATLALLLAALCFAIYLSEAGLPEWMKRRIVAAASEQGLQLTFGAMRLHWLQGITVDNAVLEGPGFPGVFKAERIILDLDQSALWERRLRLKSFALQRADLSLVPSDPGLDPILVHGLEGRMSFPATNVVTLDHLEGHWRAGILSMQLAVTNPAAMASRMKSGPTGAPGGGRSLTNGINQVARTLTKLDLKGTPTLRISMAGDAADPFGLSAAFVLTVPEATTPWGTVTNLNLGIRSVDESNLSDPEAGKLEIQAGGASTPWGRSGSFRAVVDFVPTQRDINDWSLSFRASLESADVRVAAAKAVEVDGRARMTTSSAWPDSLEAHVNAVGLTSKWAKASSIELTISRSSETNEWTTTTDLSSLAVWTNLLPHRFSVSANASNLSAAGLEFSAVEAVLDWSAPLLSVNHVSAEMPTGRASATAGLDIFSRVFSGRIDSSFALTSARDLLNESGRRWLDQFTWGPPPKIEATVRLVLPAWTDPPDSWRDDLQPSLQLAGRFDADHIGFHGVMFDRAVGGFSHTNLVWRVTDGRMSRPEGGLDLDLESHDRGAHQTIRLRSTIGPEALRPVMGDHADKVFEMVQFPVPPLIEGTAELFKDDLKRSTFVGRIATTNVLVRDVDTGFTRAGLDFSWPWVRFENTHVERGTQWLAAPVMWFNLEDQMLTISNATGQADVEPVGRIIGPKTWRMLSAYEFLDPPEVEINGITPVHQEDRDKADLSFNVKAGRFRWKYFNVDRFTGNARWTGDGLQLTNMAASAYTGTAGGWATFAFDDKEDADVLVDFRFRADVADLDLKAVLNDLGVTNRVEGGLTGNLVVTDGSTYRPTGWNGYGHAELTNGFLWDYPVFAFLSPMINAISPGAGRDAARSARGDYFITNNVIFTDKLEIRASTVRLNYRGSVTFDHRLDARVDATLLRDTWFVGPILSLALSPFSKAFEYRVTGTLSEPEMEPIYVPSVFMKLLTPFDSLKSKPSATPPSAPAPAVENRKVDERGPPP